MSHYICSWHDDRIAGEARNLYLNLFKGDNSLRLRLIVCDHCADGIVADWFPKSLYKNEDGRWAYPMPADTPESILDSLDGLPASFSRRKVA